MILIEQLNSCKKASLTIDFSYKKNKITTELENNSNIFANTNVKLLSIQTKNYYTYHIFLSDMCELLFKIIENGNIRNIEFENCEGIKYIFLQKLIKFSKYYHIYTLNFRFRNIKFQSSDLDLFIEHFDKIKIDYIYINDPRRLKCRKLADEIRYLFGKRKGIINSKLTLLLIHRYCKIPGFPPRGVILMICDRF